METALSDRLVAIVGKAHVREGDIVAPSDAAQVAAVLAATTAARMRVRHVVGVSRLPAAAAPQAAALTVSLHRLTTLEVGSHTLVARAGAGVKLTALLEAIRGASLQLASPIVGGNPRPTHVGEAVDSGALARRVIQGIECVTARGEVVRAGGAMPRDVAGFDLCTALLGAGGSLGLVTTVWFRLIPAAAGVEAHHAPGVSDRSALDQLVVQAFDPDGLLVGADA